MAGTYIAGVIYSGSSVQYYFIFWGGRGGGSWHLGDEGYYTGAALGAFPTCDDVFTSFVVSIDAWHLFLYTHFVEDLRSLS